MLHYRKKTVKRGYEDDAFNDFMAKMNKTKDVVLNRGAAQPLGVLKSSRGTTNFWILRLFTSKL